MKNKWYTYVAIACAAWFALTSWFWAYLVNLFISYPFGLVALFLYFIGKRNDPENKLNKGVLIILIVGWLISIGSILVFTLAN